MEWSDLSPGPLGAKNLRKSTQRLVLRTVLRIWESFGLIKLRRSKNQGPDLKSRERNWKSLLFEFGYGATLAFISVPLEPGLHPVNGGRLRHSFPTATQDLDLWADERAYRLMPVYNDVPSRDLSVSGIHRFHQSIYDKSKPSLAGRSVATESTAWKVGKIELPVFPLERSDWIRCLERDSYPGKVPFERSDWRSVATESALETESAFPDLSSSFFY